VNPYAGPNSFCEVDTFVDVDLYAKYKFNGHFEVHGSAGNYSNAFHDAGAIGRFFMVGLTYRL
jgi:hypothetical protein